MFDLCDNRNVIIYKLRFRSLHQTNGKHAKTIRLLFTPFSVGEATKPYNQSRFPYIKHRKRLNGLMQAKLGNPNGEHLAWRRGLEWSRDESIGTSEIGYGTTETGCKGENRFVEGDSNINQKRLIIN